MVESGTLTLDEDRDDDDSSNIPWLRRSQSKHGSKE